MSRYFFYLYLLGMFINTIFFVPRILLGERFDGAILALIMGTALGSTFAILFTKAMNKFPGEGVPEIFRKMLPAAIRIPYLLFLGIMWPLAGSIILIAFSSITLRFLSPETDPTVLLLCYCGVGCWAASFRHMAILNVAEIVIVLNLPFVAYIMYKAMANQWFDWDEVKVLSDYVWRVPSWTTMAAATYPFTGYINLALYNRVYKEMKVKHLWLVPVIGSFVLFVSFVVPVGLLGVDAVSDYLYVWISATDTLRMQFGFIERVVYLFLFIYIGFSLLFVAVTWNIGSLLIQSIFQKKQLHLFKRKVSLNWLICVIFGLATFIFGLRSDDKGLIAFVNHWQSIRLAAEFTLVSLVVWMAWRQKHA